MPRNCTPFALLVLCILLAMGSAPAAAGPKAEEPICHSANACLHVLQKVSGNKQSLGDGDRALVERLLSFGPEIVPALVDVLADSNESAAELAGFALRETQYIDVQFLPQITAGLDRGLGWLAPALCRMEGDASAREAVKRFVVSDSAPHKQEAYALKLCGRRAIPHIVEAARCRIACDSKLYFNLGYVLSEMGEERLEAAPGLLQIAGDSEASPDVAAGALVMIGALGAKANFLESDLIELRERRSDLEAAVNHALVGIESHASGQIFIERLTLEPDPVTLRDLAEIGRAGELAGPTVVKLLDDEDWNLRIAAARALGFVGYAEAAAPLIRLLRDPADVRLNWVAAQSLGRLEADEAVPALRVTAETHWYPPVRSAAVAAIEHIEQRVPYEDSSPRGNFAFEFFDYEHFGRDQSTCEKPLLKRKPESKSQKLYSSNAPEQLKKLEFATYVLGYGPAVEPPPRDDREHEVMELTSENIVEHRTPTRQVPDVALRVDNGWLAGSDRGEWGGELVFINDNGLVNVILDENIKDIYSFDDRVIALTGLAHLTMNSGIVHSLTRDASGNWSAHPWRALTGAPLSSWRVETGEVLINVASGGTLLLNHDGSFRIAPCNDR